MGFAKLQLLSMCVNIVVCVLFAVSILSPNWAVFYVGPTRVVAGPILKCARVRDSIFDSDSTIYCSIIQWNELEQLIPVGFDDDPDANWYKGARVALGLGMVLSFGAFMLHMASLCARFSRLIPHGVLNILAGILSLAGFATIQKKLKDINDYIGDYSGGSEHVWADWGLYTCLGASIVSVANGVLCFFATKQRSENAPQVNYPGYLNEAYSHSAPMHQQHVPQTIYTSVNTDAYPVPTSVSTTNKQGSRLYPSMDINN